VVRLKCFEAFFSMQAVVVFDFWNLSTAAPAVLSASECRSAKGAAEAGE
jgi:hypothetical protein